MGEAKTKVVTYGTMTGVEMPEAKSQTVGTAEYMGCVFQMRDQAQKRFMASRGLSSNDLAVLGLQEMIRYFWFGINELGLLSMLSVRVHEAARNGRAWRRAVRAMFPHHPFEVDLDTCCRYYSIRCFLFCARRIDSISTTFPRAQFENLASKYLPQCSQTGT